MPRKAYKALYEQAQRQAQDAEDALERLRYRTKRYTEALACFADTTAHRLLERSRWKIAEEVEYVAPEMHTALECWIHRQQRVEVPIEMDGGLSVLFFGSTRIVTREHHADRARD